MVLLTTKRSNPVLRALLGLILAIPTIAGVVWDEVLLAGPIILLVNFFGFWLGYVVFCLAWAALGLFLFSVWRRIEPWVREKVLSKFFRVKAKVKEEETEAEPNNWRERLALRFARIARFLGALVAAVILGPVFGWPVFKLLGYKEREVVLFTIGAAWIFGAIWVPFYGLGVWGFGLSRLF